MQRGKTAKEGSVQPIGNSLGATAVFEKGTVSAPVLGTLEAAKVLSTLVDILGSASTSVVLGVKSENSDPICEGLRRILNRNAPLLVQREIIPGDPRTTETFDVRDMVMDNGYAGACLDFRMDSTVPESGMNCDEIIERLGQWKKPISITGTYALETQEGEEEEDEDDDTDES
jgi:hypothetical protein